MLNDEIVCEVQESMEGNIEAVLTDCSRGVLLTQGTENEEVAGKI